MPAIDALQNLKTDLIRKTLNGSVFIAPYTAATVSETTLFNATTGDLQTLPAGFRDLGYLTEAGASFNRAITKVDVNSWQSLPPTRTDLTADVTTLQVICQETNLRTLGLFTGAADTAFTPAGPNGVIRIDAPARPIIRRYRLLSISVDETDLGEIVMARYLPKAMPTSYGKQDFATATEVHYDVTFTAFSDDVLGTPESYMFGGAGWLARLSAMGIARTVIASTTSASTTLTATTGTFSAADVGKTLTGTGIPAGVTVATFTDATHVIMSAAATATGTLVPVSVL
jgi:hypothetical protein